MKGQKIPWRPEATLAAMNAKAHDTMVETLGIVLTDVGDDYLKGTMPVTSRNCQPMRILHGGASVAFAEGYGDQRQPPPTCSGWIRDRHLQTGPPG